ncbi:hypothetical protein D3C81_1773140 [compost metagenome]
MLVTSIPDAAMVMMVPNAALSEKASTNGVARVWMNPRKKVMTEAIMTRTSTPLFSETAAQPSFNSRTKDWGELFL